MLVKIGYYNVFRNGASELRAEVAQEIARKNKLSAIPSRGEIWGIPEGTKITVDDFWSGSSSSGKGWSAAVKPLRELAAQAGRVIQCPGSKTYGAAEGEYSPEAYIIL